MKKKLSKVVSKRLSWMIIGGGALYIGLLVFGLFSRDHGIRVSLQLHSECNRMRSEITAVRQENAEMRRSWDRLTGDLRFIEKLAREELNMVADNEIVFVFE